jgi:hypothetical protein
MKLISTFLKIQNQLRIYHWQTPSYAQHKAFGEAYENLNELIDNFVEVYLGKNKSGISIFTFKFELNSYDENYIKFIDTCILFLNNLAAELNEEDTDLFNIRDEMIAVLNKLKYLLQLS